MPAYRFLICAIAVVLQAAPTWVCRATTAAAETESSVVEQRNAVHGAEVRFRFHPSGMESHWEKPIRNNPYGSLERKNSEPALTYGAEVDYFYDRLVFRGIYQQGQYTFDGHGDTECTSVAFLLGLRNEVTANHHSFIGIGVRRVEASRSYLQIFANENEELEYQEVYVEFFGGSKPAKRGFLVDGSVGMSLLGLPNLFRDEGHFEHFGITLAVTFGFRLHALPLAVTVGGEMHAYQFEYEWPPDPGPSFRDIFGRALIDATYGAVCRISYSIGESP